MQRWQDFRTTRQMRKLCLCIGKNVCINFYTISKNIKLSHYIPANLYKIIAHIIKWSFVNATLYIKYRQTDRKSNLSTPINVNTAFYELSTLLNVLTEDILMFPKSKLFVKTVKLHFYVRRYLQCVKSIKWSSHIILKEYV